MRRWKLRINPNVPVSTLVIVGVVVVVTIGAGLHHFPDIIMVVAVPHILYRIKPNKRIQRKSKFMRMCK
jgi:hypothetical protein